jgi:hypothetical protein
LSIRPDISHDTNGLSDEVNPDNDGDRLGDYDEFVLGTDLFKPDTDNDRATDGDEVIAGTSPTNASEYFAIEGMSAVTNGGDLVMLWNTVSGRWYSVYSTTNLLEPAWETNVYRSLSDGGIMSYTNTDAAIVRFFRLGVER